MVVGVPRPMVGEWIDDGGNVVVRSSCRWSDDGNFLLQEFNLQIGEREAQRVTQRIGWDPLAKRIRSWVFDSDGGFGESVWARDGDAWIINGHKWFISGAVGGNIAGVVLKNFSLGAAGNSIAGVIGGVIGGQILNAILGPGTVPDATATEAGGTDIGSIIGSIAGGGIGGAILMIIVGLIRKATAK